MASLTGASIASSYTSLLKLNGNTDSLVAGNGSNAIQVVDGDGTASNLYLNTDRVGIGGQPSADLHIFGQTTRIAHDTPDFVLEDTSAFSAGTGPSIYLQGKQTGEGLQTFAEIQGVSTSSVNEGTLIFKTRSGGSTTQKMSIDTDGKVTVSGALTASGNLSSSGDIEVYNSSTKTGRIDCGNSSFTTLASSGTVTISSSRAGGALICAYELTSGAGGVFAGSHSTTMAKVNASSDSSVSDSGTNPICLYKSSGSATITLKNRSASDKSIFIMVLGASVY